MQNDRSVAAGQLIQDLPLLAGLNNPENRSAQRTTEAPSAKTLSGAIPATADRRESGRDQSTELQPNAGQMPAIGVAITLLDHN